MYCGITSCLCKISGCKRIGSPRSSVVVQSLRISALSKRTIFQSNSKIPICLCFISSSYRRKSISQSSITWCKTKCFFCKGILPGSKCVGACCIGKIPGGKRTNVACTGAMAYRCRLNAGAGISISCSN